LIFIDLQNVGVISAGSCITTVNVERWLDQISCHVIWDAELV